jgi:ketosteroid isomerase-like protein
MNRNLVTITAVLFLVTLVMCRQPKNGIPDSAQLMQLDRDFSLFSIKNGMKKAFLEYADTAVVLLRKNNYPIEGRKSLAELVKNIPDSLFTLKWEPLRAAISSSGDMGFTYGIYDRIPADTLNGKKTERGSYVTIWKKQADESWKLIFDAGNEGLGK